MVGMAYLLWKGLLSTSIELYRRVAGCSAATCFLFGDFSYQYPRIPVFLACFAFSFVFLVVVHLAIVATGLLVCSCFLLVVRDTHLHFAVHHYYCLSFLPSSQCRVVAILWRVCFRFYVRWFVGGADAT